MNFEKRDIILVAGIGLLIAGLAPFMAPVIAIIVGVAVFFGIKWYASKRKQQFAKEAGEGFCIKCGEKIIENKCPNCDDPKSA